MPSFLDIVANAKRDIEIDVRGVLIKITENLMTDPKAEREANRRGLEVTRKALEAISELRKRQVALSVEAGENKTGTDKTDNPDTERELIEMEANLNAVVQMYEDNERAKVCRQIASRFLLWDLTDETGVLLPLTVSELENTDVPTKCLVEIMEAVNKEPLVPNEKG